MIRRCGWCGKVLGEKDGQGVDDETTGVCETCYQRLLAEAEELSKKGEWRWKSGTERFGTNSASSARH